MTIKHHVHTFSWFFVIGIATAACGDNASDGASSELDAPEAEAVASNALLVDDVNNDGRNDLAVWSKWGDGFLSTKLLNKGDGVFDRWESVDDSDALPDLNGPAWVFVETATTAQLLESMHGFEEAIGSLPSDSLDSLGLGSTGTLRPQASKDCRPGQLCFWENSSYTGRNLRFTNVNSSANIGGWFNDKMTSYWNRTRKAYIFFQNTNYRGTHVCSKAGSSSAAVRSGFNDRMSSFRVKRSNDFCQF
jgi:hypothetical protein